MDQGLREGSLAMDPYNFQGYNYGGNQRMFEGMSFDDCTRNINAKLDYVTLNVQMDTITNLFEQKGNANAFNSNYVVCDLCGSNHATYTCMQAQYVDYYDEFEHYNSCFDQYGANCDNPYTYGWNNPCVYDDSSCFYDYQPNGVQNDSKPCWEVAIEKLTNTTSDNFDRVEKRLDELAFHFEGIQDQLHNLCEVISYSEMPIDPTINGENVVCESGMYFDGNDESYLYFNDEISISHDDNVGMNVESQEVSMHDVYITPFEKCGKCVDFKVIIPQEGYMDIPLVSSQVMEKGNIYETLEIGKPLPSFLSFGYMTHLIESPFNDSPRPQMVDYSLTKPP